MQATAVARSSADEVGVLLPSPGDLVVMLDGATSRYAIARVPGKPQVSWASRQAALSIAYVIARRHAVDVWIDDGKGSRPLQRHRRPLSPRRAGVASSSFGTAWSS